MQVSIFKLLLPSGQTLIFHRHFTKERKAFFKYFFREGPYSTLTQRKHHFPYCTSLTSSPAVSSVIYVLLPKHRLYQRSLLSPCIQSVKRFERSKFNNVLCEICVGIILPPGATIRLSLLHCSNACIILFLTFKKSPSASQRLFTNTQQTRVGESNRSLQTSVGPIKRCFKLQIAN